ncbi:hypothetical protein [Streptomyces sp. TRM49041]|uniref:hypothetical protein n=1 Tax=Streptomyces sp. TRM49041 TaxID=2603216 RepID=UPI0011ECA1CE|nr:hypothetical protein [Streptomyces sp. TRM49041]
MFIDQTQRRPVGRGRRATYAVLPIAGAAAMVMALSSTSSAVEHPDDNRAALSAADLSASLLDTTDGACLPT